jgi:uncharacterized protein with HEPN domain
MFNRDDHILLADIMVAIEKIQRYTTPPDTIKIASSPMSGPLMQLCEISR